MIDSLPLYISIAFILITFQAVMFFYWSAGKSKLALYLISAWLLLQTAISLTGFYTVTDILPPRLLLLVLPPLILIGFLFFTRNGQRFIDGLDPKLLTLLHIVRIPVELILYALFLYKAVPEVMTFEGRNLDILSGLTAPLVYYLAYVKKVLSKGALLAWNFICLALLLNIVLHAVLSAPFPFQQFGFNQPNIAVLYFPFVWLPCCVVPLVLLSHLAVIRRIIIKNSIDLQIAEL